MDLPVGQVEGVDRESVASSDDITTIPNPLLDRKVGLSVITARRSYGQPHWPRSANSCTTATCLVEGPVNSVSKTFALYRPRMAAQHIYRDGSRLNAAEAPGTPHRGSCG